MKPAFALPLDTQPMEARSADIVPEEGGPWLYEPKWDGFRCLAFKSGEAVDLRAKSGKPLGRYFPEIVAMLGALPACRAVVDGEIVIADADGPAFDALQMRLHPAEGRVRKLAAETPAQLILFDMLADPDGRSLLDVPLSRRRRALEDFVAAADRENLTLSRCTRDAAEAKAWLGESGHGATDGVVAKLLEGGYEAGARTMVKVKRRTASWAASAISPPGGRSDRCCSVSTTRLANSTTSASPRPSRTRRGRNSRSGWRRCARRPASTARRPAARAAGAPSAVAPGSRCGRSWSWRSASTR
jgi:ATP-dependent DNA ligase